MSKNDLPAGCNRYDRRRGPRYGLLLEAKGSVQLGKEWIRFRLVLANVGTNGATVWLNEEDGVRIKPRMQIEMGFTHPVSGEHLRLQGVVVWGKRVTGSSLGRWSFGIGVVGQDEAVLRQLVDSAARVWENLPDMEE